MPGTLWLLLLVPVVFIALTALMFFLMVRLTGTRAFEIVEVDESGRPVEPQGAQGYRWERAPRPWWGDPLLWVGVSAVFILLGLFVLPHLLGGALLFLPFIWISRPRVRAVRRTTGR